MKDVAETHHLTKRGDTWYYHRRVPEKLVPVLKKRFVKRSLGTKSLEEARVLRNILNVQTDADFAIAENGGSLKSEASNTSSLEILIEHLREHIEALDQRSSSRLAEDPPESEDQRSDMVADVGTGLSILRNRDDPRGNQWIASTYDKVISAQNIKISDEKVVVQFAEIIRRGLMELQRRKLDRLGDLYDISHHDPLFAPDRSSKTTFGQLAEIFWAERLEEYQANQVAAKRSDKVQTELSYILEAIGSELPLSMINDDAVQKVRRRLDLTPLNRRKLYPKLSLEDAIKRGAKEGKPTLSPTTQGQYLRTLRDTLAVGVRELPPENRTLT